MRSHFPSSEDNILVYRYPFTKTLDTQDAPPNLQHPSISYLHERARGSLVTLLAVHSAADALESISLFDFPVALRGPFDPGYHGWDFSRIFADAPVHYDRYCDGQAYARWGIDRTRGAVIIVRPDMHVGWTQWHLQEFDQQRCKKGLCLSIYSVRSSRRRGNVITDRLLGNVEGWEKGFTPKPVERGVTTHVYASFDASLKANNSAPGTQLTTLYISHTNTVGSDMLYNVTLGTGPATTTVTYKNSLDSFTAWSEDSEMDRVIGSSNEAKVIASGAAGGDDEDNKGGQSPHTIGNDTSSLFWDSETNFLGCPTAMVLVSRWEQFLERMKGFARKTLLSARERGRDGEAILNQLEWNVQQNPALDNCSKEEIWRRHRDLMSSLYGEYHPGDVQHGYPIMVDREALDSVLEGTAPSEWRAADFRASTAHVIVLNMNWFDQMEEKRLRREERRRLHGDGHGEAEDEGDDGLDKTVGWKKVLVVKVYPRLYSFLLTPLWHIMYAEPPEIERLP
ncbi:uncharacterized protein CDV56_105740 [Aspergillus thermomutatus]|uniref:Phenol hydroxylase-like C-terminal dimerisation domain-containing protein n=1 Tax=Aspergillus thermomutatus TaxID=41047 RepID=A0A397H3S5_ASPTH|nr:uncharacterized protein CDV56_105740 [Aspergillus thermomutatus]RHZ57399.1 hypothetical protein CDV56_105740 [Aspergillus thermomutatus]